MLKLFLILLSVICAIEPSFILYEEQDNIGLLTINRPKALNALNSQVLDELSQSLDKIDTEKVRVLIITGSGEKSFVAGADISEMSSLTKQEAEAFSKKGNDVFRKIETFPIPVIAAVNGFALGGGCELSMSCDIRICSDNAIFGQPEVGLGITPGFGGTQRLPRIIGVGMAKQMIYTGQNIKADQALTIGLVNAVYPQKELLNEAKKLAATIAKNGANAIKMSKKAINEGTQVDIDSAIVIEEKLFGECFENDEQINGMKNFLEKSKKKSKNLKEVPKKEESKEIAELPKGELKPTKLLENKFIFVPFNMTIPKMPSILTAGDKNGYNSMVIGWGAIGVGYARPLFIVFVKPERYTYDFIQKSDIFTVSYIDDKLYSKFGVYGSKSGRDMNKEEKAGTHIKFLDDGGITFEEAKEVYVCKTLLKLQPSGDDEVSKELIDYYNKYIKIYKTDKVHGVFIGEIIGHYKRE